MQIIYKQLGKIELSLPEEKIDNSTTDTQICEDQKQEWIFLFT